MVPEYNAQGGYRARKTTERQDDRPGRGEAVDRYPHAQAEAAEGSIDAIFDPGAQGQAEVLKGHTAAFGDDYWEVESLGDGKVVLKMYPGGARRLL